MLPKLYQEILIPPAVIAELATSDSPLCDWMKNLPSWIKVQGPKQILADLELDAGECEAISLAVELHADRLLIDELPWRKAAIAHGLKVAGTFAVILDAVESKLIDGIAALDQLEKTNFFASKELYNAVREKLKKTNSI